MIAIVVYDRHFAIGNQNQLLARLPADMKRFKEITTGHTILMGRKTYLSLPKRPLPDRKNIVLTTAPQLFPDVLCMTNLQEVLTYEQKSGEALFVCGGAAVYAALFPYCKEIYATEIQHTFAADTYIPDFTREPAWACTYRSEPIETGGYLIRFCNYRNLSPRLLDNP